ncbi:MAG TPA: ABC transporter permease subunit [Bacilli bacterium]|jgi:NitT/TauT family transport system permease protein|nr:ABC transporter permease subunit [Acholeplasmataceae bacterium]HNZ77444.1 ABC transporter permease subunit [Bacilli bacterium]HOD61635.1 ABC transporter permease subunit [Bacilli bacterium]HOH61649.1 ABC transporter permease subunit [Bacilli bacterium]HPB48853.1 ABC transporter permease subunit [Bacilli bacterium]
MKKFITKINFWLFGGILFILLVWFFASRIVDNSIVIPKISEVLQALGSLLQTKQTYVVIFNTISRLILTISISFVLALFCSILAGSITRVKDFLKPIMTLMRTTPVAAVIIILLMIFGNIKSPYIITSLVILPIMYEGILVSFENIDQGIIDEVKMLSNLNFRVAKEVYLPIVTPQILSTLVATIGLGLKVMVMSEFIAQPNNTIGYVMLQEKNFLEMDYVFAWTIVLVVFVLLVEELLKIIKTKL